jgi:hypothetical protein
MARPFTCGFFTIGAYRPTRWTQSLSFASPRGCSRAATLVKSSVGGRALDDVRRAARIDSVTIEAISERGGANFLSVAEP